VLTRAMGGGPKRALALVANCSLFLLISAGGSVLAVDPGPGEPTTVPPAPEASAAEPDKERDGRRESTKPGGWGLDVFPVIFSTPETGFGGGAGCVLTHRRAQGDEHAFSHSVPVFLYYTEKKQSNVAIAPDLYFREGHWHVKASVAYEKLPSYFYEVGDYVAEDYLEDADKEDYTLEAASLQPWVLRRVVSRLRAGVVYDLRKTSVLEVEEGGILQRELVDGRQGGVQSGLGPALEWDSRNHVFYPSRGGWYQLYCLFYHHRLGGDFDFQGYWIDLRHFFTVRSPHLLAFQVWASKRAGHIPFTRYAAIGGQMRGIHAERLQDRYAAVAQAEYRYPIWRRFSGVAFVSLGEVAHRAGGFTLRDVKYAGGAGLRFALNPADKLNVRFDVGISEWGAETYFQIQEAF
jgi:hypothetical protein